MATTLKAQSTDMHSAWGAVVSMALCVAVLIASEFMPVSHTINGGQWQLRTREGWVYLAVILDLFSRRVVGWAIGNRMKQDLALRALNMAIALRGPAPGCIHHTDRGSQYCANDYQKLLRKRGFKVSMRGKGNCHDNSAVESFFKSLKAEMVWRHEWQTRRQVEGAIFKYINGFYNPRRRHSALGWNSPVAFEKKAA